MSESKSTNAGSSAAARGARARKIAGVSLAEMERRWKLLRDHMAERKLDALVAVGGHENLSGYVRWMTESLSVYRHVVIFYPDRPMSVIEHGRANEVRTLDGNDPDKPGVGEVATVAEFPSVHYTQSYEVKFAIDILKRGGCRTIGLLGRDNMPHGFVRSLEEALKGTATFTDETEFVDHCKAIKSPEEIELIRQTARMQDEVFAQLLPRIRPGMRDFEIASLVQHEGRLRGGYAGVLLVGSAPRGTPAFYQPDYMQGRVLSKGDHVTVLIEDAGPAGYFQEVARTIVLGKADPELLEAFDQAKGAQDYTLSLCKPGALCRDVARAYNSYMTDRGLPPERRVFAHGQGYDIVERPLIREDETMRIEPGMAFAIHPAAVTASSFAVVCDNYIVGKEGPGDCLHKTEKRVFEV